MGIYYEAAFLVEIGAATDIKVVSGSANDMEDAYERACEELETRWPLAEIKEMKRLDITGFVEQEVGR